MHRHPSVPALCRVQDIPDGGAMAVAPGGDERESVILLREGTHVRAYRNVCPHAGNRLDWAPGRFLIKDGVLVCAAHGASFRAESGGCIGGPCRGEALAAVSVQVREGQVYLVGTGIRDQGPGTR